MAAGRVTGSQEAKQTILQMQRDFQQNLDKMKSDFARANRILLDPNHWAGPDQQKYQNSIVPDVNNMIAKQQTDLNDLSNKMHQILGDILAAGGAS